MVITQAIIPPSYYCNVVKAILSFSKVLLVSVFFHCGYSLSLLANDNVVRLASWNLLAPFYAAPAKYPWCDERHLDWEYRKTLIAQQIFSIQADIFCLQEVQFDLFPELLERLHPHYVGLTQNVTGNHKVGCAVLLRRDCHGEKEDPRSTSRLLKNSREMRFWQVEAVRVESRSRALIAILKLEHISKRQDDALNSSPFLYLCNVHLEAGMTHDDNLARYYQLKSLFKRLKRQCERDGIPMCNAPVVMAGDFNMLHSNPLHTFLSQGLLEPPRATTIPKHIGINEKGKATKGRNGSSRNANVRKTKWILKRPKKPSIHASTPTIKLSDAYLSGLTSSVSASEATISTKVVLESQSHKPYQQLAMTYSSGAVLDYIWTSETVVVHEALILNPQAARTKAQQWPSKEFPSDHIPIGIDLSWSEQHTERSNVSSAMNST